MKRSPALEPFSHDHHNGLVAVSRLRKGLQREADVGVMADYVAHLWADELAPHFEAEEAFLIEPLRDVGEGALADRMLDEHRTLEDLKDRLASPADRRGHLAAFVELLGNHIRFEERTVFPLLEQKADAETLSRIARGLEDGDEPSSSGEFTPVFWL